MPSWRPGGQSGRLDHGPLIQGQHLHMICVCIVYSTLNLASRAPCGFCVICAY